jgi:hypothetical protein
MSKNQWEELAKQMRERALTSTEPFVIRETIYQPSEEQKKLYYHAGRWAGGARDYAARKAYEELYRQGEI